MRIPLPATSTATDAVITLVFSELVSAPTVSGATFRLLHAATGELVPGSSAAAGGARSAVFVPAAPLPPDTRYRVEATTGVTDLAGNALVFYSAEFATGPTADDEPPQVVAVSPPDGSAGVPVNTQVAVTISEPVQTASLGPQAIVVRTGGVAAAGTLAVSADRRRLVFTPAAPLAPATAYAVAIGGLADRSGNPVPDVASAFTTRADAALDDAGPAVIDVSPAPGASGVGVTAPVVLTFDEPVDPGTVGLASVPVMVDGFAGAFPGTYAVAGGVVTFTPAVPYPGSVRVEPRVASGGVLDLAGNGAASFSTFFDTEPVPDLTLPAVVMVSPADGSTGVGPEAEVVLTFSEPIDPATVDAEHFDLLADGERLLARVDRSDDNRTVILVATLPPEALITVVVTAGVADLSGNLLGGFESEFTTAPASDFGMPRVVTQRPGNGAAGVAANASMVLFTSEPLDATTLPGALFIAADGVLADGNVAVTGNGRAIEFTPDLPWASNALVQVFLTADARDVAGNAVIPFQGSFRIAQNTASLAPSVVRTHPVGAAVGVPRNPVIEVQYSEPLDPATVHSGTVVLRQNTPGQPVVAATVSLVRGGRV
ncbi:MAG: Ig-like domain-containing protein, partial [Chloroflexi bacterium]|nr:Ig-like domain-containing protein [Chloroflexota bacterium]